MKLPGKRIESIFSTHPQNKTIKEKHTKVKVSKNMEWIGKIKKRIRGEEITNTDHLYRGKYIKKVNITRPFSHPASQT